MGGENQLEWEFEKLLIILKFHLNFHLQVVNWLEGPGSEQLRAQWGIGDSIRASQALQQKHEEIESQHSVRGFFPLQVTMLFLMCMISSMRGAKWWVAV